MKSKMYSNDIILILIASFFYFSSPMLVTPLITGFTESLGAGGALMGIVGGLMNICSLFCRPFVGNLADKISKYKVSFIGAALMTVASIGYIAAFDPVVVVLSRIVNGVGYACCSVCMSTWMSNLLPENKIGSGMGIYGTMNALGMAVAPAIGVSLYQKLGYRPAFVVAALFSAAIAVIIQFVQNKGEPSAASAGVHKKLELIDVKVIPIAVIIMLFSIPYCATQSFLVTYIDARNLPVTVSLFFPLYAAILLLLRLTMRNLFDKKPFSFFIVLSSVSAFLSISVLAVMRHNFSMFFAAVFMAGGYGIMCSVCQSTAILLAGKEKRGLANSTYYIGLDLGMALGPIIGGLLYEHLDIRFFYPVLALTVPLALAAYWLNRRKFRLRKTS
ncbi:MAG TPA: MFS transporter [Candidatus Blautia avicola]|uniref:MFS transporter n=1 Tax=Candidatus Blautia avicola TaxID=2838483 RepID=A0A9D2QTM4_9FIRM|nr:MFS transporter [Candidatus Blautia avicola]